MMTSVFWRLREGRLAVDGFWRVWPGFVDDEGIFADYSWLAEQF